jgi:hypothetical protein
VPKRDEVTVEWRKLHNDELNDLYCSPNIVWVIKSRRIRWAEHVACRGEKEDTCWVLVGKLEGKRPFGIHKCRWKDTVKIDLQEIGYGGMDWIDLAQDRGKWSVGSCEYVDDLQVT